MSNCWTVNRALEQIDVGIDCWAHGFNGEKAHEPQILNKTNFQSKIHIDYTTPVDINISAMGIVRTYYCAIFTSSYSRLLSIYILYDDIFRSYFFSLLRFVSILKCAILFKQRHQHMCAKLVALVGSEYYLLLLLFALLMLLLLLLWIDVDSVAINSIGVGVMKRVHFA